MRQGGVGRDKLVGPVWDTVWEPIIMPLIVLLVLVVVATFWAICTINYIYIDMIIMRL